MLKKFKIAPGKEGKKIAGKFGTHTLDAKTLTDEVAEQIYNGGKSSVILLASDKKESATPAKK